MSNNSQKKDRQSINELISINAQQFQLLALQKEGQCSQNPELGLPLKQHAIDQLLDSTIGYSPEQNNLSANNRLNDGKEIELQSRMIEKCHKCADLQAGILRLQNEKKKIQTQLIKAHDQLNQMKKQRFKDIAKVRDLGKQQLNFHVTSLKQMIKCFEQENERLKSWMVKTLNIKEKGQNSINIRQIIENTITDLLANDRQLDSYISQILMLSCGKSSESAQFRQDQGNSCKEMNIFNRFYESRRKLQMIKTNLLKIRKQPHISY